MTMCTQEEADTRIVLCTSSMRPKIRFGSGKNEKHLNLGQISPALGPSMCLAMPIFHALSECDTTSAFRTQGKKR